MAGKTTTAKPQTAKPASAAAAPAEKKTRQPRTPREPAVKPADVKPKDEALAAGDQPKELNDVQKVFLENLAHALIFDIFQLPHVLNAIRQAEDQELQYFLDYYASRLRPLLISDQQTGNIDALLDLGAWAALDDQAEVLTVQLMERLAGYSATPTQIKKLLIEATYGVKRDERPSRGERWMPSKHRSGSREDLARCHPRHVSDNAHQRS